MHHQLFSAEYECWCNQVPLCCTNVGRGAQVSAVGWIRSPAVLNDATNLVATDVTHVAIYSTQMGGSPSGRPWGKWDAAHTVELNSSLLLLSCQHLCGRDRDYTCSWRVSYAGAQQRCRVSIYTLPSSRRSADNLVTCDKYDIEKGRGNGSIAWAMIGALCWSD